MFRKIVLCLLLIIFPSVVMASANSTAMVGGKYYDSFEYSKYKALIDAPEYACELILYDD